MPLADELIRMQAAVRAERRERIEGLRDAVRRAEARVAEVNARILAAAPGPRDDAERRAAAAAVAAAVGPAERAARELRAAKALAARRKDEIAGWKAWHATLTPDEQGAHAAALAREIDWRAAELDGLTARIPALDAERLRLAGALEVARAAAAAAEHGLLPADDPRVAGLHRELEDARAALEPALVALQAAETQAPAAAPAPERPAVMS